MPKPAHRLGEEANGVWLIRVDEADGLLAQHAFVEVAVKKRVGDVELACWPTLSGDQGEHGADRRRLDDRRKRLAKVDVGPLHEATDDPARLVPLEAAVGVEFMFEHPFAGDDVGAQQPRDKASGVVRLEHVEFALHRLLPIWITQRCPCRAGDRRYVAGVACSRGHGIPRVVTM